MKEWNKALGAAALAAALAGSPDRGRAQDVDYFKIDPQTHTFGVKPTKDSEKINVCPSPKEDTFEVTVMWEKPVDHHLQHQEPSNTTTYPFSQNILNRQQPEDRIYSPGMGYRGAGHLYKRVDENTLILFDRVIDGGPVTIKLDCKAIS